jgi:hypothetical protein
MNIRNRFIEFTRVTVPKDSELSILGKLLPDYLMKDPAGNLYIKIGESDVMFASHLDTVGFKSENVNHIFDKDFIRTDGKTILGADDKAGVVLMLYMIEKGIPGYYFFFLGEEKGCIGSGKLSKWMLNNNDNEFSGIKKVIAFDRAGYNSVITHQSFQRSCSDEFADALIEEFKKNGLLFKKDTTGSYCDSAEFADIFPECTNLSVGYFEQHKNYEKQNIVFLEKLAEVCCKIDWNSLPYFRDPYKLEFLDDFYSSKKGNPEDIKDYIKDHYDDETETLQDIDPRKITIDFFIDKEFNFLSDVSYYNGEIVDINISKKRIDKELDIIQDYLEDNNVDYNNIYWDGFILYIDMETTNFITKISRSDLVDLIPEIDISKIKGYVNYERN